VLLKIKFKKVNFSIDTYIILAVMIIIFINLNHYDPYLGMGGRIYRFGMLMTF